MSCLLKEFDLFVASLPHCGVKTNGKFMQCILWALGPPVAAPITLLDLSLSFSLRLSAFLLYKHNIDGDKSLLLGLFPRSFLDYYSMGKN